MSNKNDWIELNGTEGMPVEEGTLVDVRHRDGEVFENVRAGSCTDVHAQYWGYDEEEPEIGDIMAYRLSVTEDDSK